MAEQGGGGGLSLPSVPPGTPGLPQNPLFLVFDGFEGLNTKASRAAIEDQEMAWCDNFMPLGKSNLRTLYGLGPLIYTKPVGMVLENFQFANIGPTPYCIVFLNDGSAIAVNTTSQLITPVAPPGTFSTFTPPPFVSQWGGQYILICAEQTNGYWVWDGTSLFGTGGLGPNVDILNGGADYTSQPVITAIGGSGSGATFVADIHNGVIDQITVTNPGSGYGINDAVVLGFSGGGSPGVTAQALATITGGSIASVSVTVGGAGYTDQVAAAVLGGGGFGATLVPVAASGTIASVSVSAGGAGYVSVATISFTDPGNPVAQAVAQLMPSGIKGTQIETYTQHVWVIDKNKVYLSAPGSVTDFAASDGGGAFPSTDSFLRVEFSSIRQSNGFLYLVGDSSVNYISGVQTGGSPPTTIFTNQNVDPQVGTPWPDTLTVYSRAVVFANSFGVHAIYGGAVQKVSSKIDGLYDSVPQSFWEQGFTPSSAVAVIFGIHVYMLLLPIFDPIDAVQRNALLMWDGARWWTASQEVPLTMIRTQEINSVLTAWGSDGISIYPMFQNPSQCLTKRVQSKLWDKPTYVMTKFANRAYLLVEALTPITNAQPAIDITFQVDTDEGSSALDTGLLSNIIWVNDFSEVVTWMSN